MIEPLTDRVLLIAATFEESARRALRQGQPRVADRLQEDARTLRAMVQAHADLRDYHNGNLLMERVG